MSDRETLPEPPQADPKQLDSEYHLLARPLYELVNQDPSVEPFPDTLDDHELERYQKLLNEVFDANIIRLETVSCKRTPGLVGRSASWTVYEEQVHSERMIRGDILELAGLLNERTEDESTKDTDYGDIPLDLMNRAVWFYIMLQERSAIPPLHPRYGQVMCRILGMGIGQPHRLIYDLLPFLVRNPPLGFLPTHAHIYSVLVA